MGWAADDRALLRPFRGRAGGGEKRDHSPVIGPLIIFVGKTHGAGPCDAAHPYDPRRRCCDCAQGPRRTTAYRHQPKARRGQAARRGGETARTEAKGGWRAQAGRDERARGFAHRRMFFAQAPISACFSACPSPTTPLNPAAEMWPSGRRHTPAKGADGNVSRVRIPSTPPLSLAKAFSRSGCGRIFPLFSRVMRVRLLTAPAARRPGSGLSGPIFSGPVDCAVLVNGS